MNIFKKSKEELLNKIQGKRWCQENHIKTAQKGFGAC